MRAWSPDGHRDSDALTLYPDSESGLPALEGRRRQFVSITPKAPELFLDGRWGARAAARRRNNEESRKLLVAQASRLRSRAAARRPNNERLCKGLEVKHREGGNDWPAVMRAVDDIAYPERSRDSVKPQAKYWEA